MIESLGGTTVERQRSGRARVNHIASVPVESFSFAKRGAQNHYARGVVSVAAAAG